MAMEHYTGKTASGGTSPQSEYIPSFSDILKTKEYKEKYDEVRDQFSIEELLGRMIVVTDWDIKSEKNMRDEQVEMATFYYYFIEDAKKIKHYTRTEAYEIRNGLKAIDKTRYPEGFTVIVEKDKLQGGFKTYRFT